MSAKKRKKKTPKVKYKSFSRIFLRAAPASRSKQSALELSWTGKSPSIDPVMIKQMFNVIELLLSVTSQLSYISKYLKTEN